jgi:hypothetical protein
MKTLADLMAEYEAERLADIEREEARRATPQERARIAAKRAAEQASQTRNRRHSIRTQQRCELSIWGV